MSRNLLVSRMLFMVSVSWTATPAGGGGQESAAFILKVWGGCSCSYSHTQSRGPGDWTVIKRVATIPGWEDVRKFIKGEAAEWSSTERGNKWVQLLSLQLISEPTEPPAHWRRSHLTAEINHKLPCARSHTLTAFITCSTSLLTLNIKDITARRTRTPEPEHTRWYLLGLSTLLRNDVRIFALKNTQVPTIQISIFAHFVNNRSNWLETSLLSRYFLGSNSWQNSLKPSVILIGFMSSHMNEASFFLQPLVLQTKSSWRLVRNKSQDVAV